jgi:PAS domain S-box-containing protein
MDDFKRSKKQLIEELILLREHATALENARALEKDGDNKILISQAEKQDLLLDSIDTHIFYLVKPDTYGAVNQAHASFFNVNKDDLEYKNLYEILSTEEADVCVAGNLEIFTNKRQIVTEEVMVDGDGNNRLYSFTKTPKLDSEGNVKYIICTGTDITEKRNAEKEREALIEDLKNALSEVKKLSGLLPICASCKKIRDDKGYWSQVEVYICDHSDVEFSHSICPDCKATIYPEKDFPYLYRE